MLSCSPAKTMSIMRSNTLFLLALAAILIGLLSALSPLSDFDQDGYLDSFVTEGFVLIPIFGVAIGLISLLTRLPATCFAIPQLFATRLVPPPIPTQ